MGGARVGTPRRKMSGTDDANVPRVEDGRRGNIPFLSCTREPQGEGFRQEKKKNGVRVRKGEENVRSKRVV